MEQTVETDPILVKGRVFRPATRTTFAQDMYVMDLVSNTEMEKMSVVSGADLNKMAEKILLDAYRSGNLFKILAGMVVEDGVKWTPQVAEENAEFFENLTDPADKEALHEAMAGVVLSFFVNAEGFLRTSPKSSSVAASSGESLELRPLQSKAGSPEELQTSGSGTR